MSVELLVKSRMHSETTSAHFLPAISTHDDPRGSSWCLERSDAAAATRLEQHGFILMYPALAASTACTTDKDI